jgi:hypothetical protein
MTVISGPVNYTKKNNQHTPMLSFPERSHSLTLSDNSGDVGARCVANNSGDKTASSPFDWMPGTKAEVT